MLGFLSLLEFCSSQCFLLVECADGFYNLTCSGVCGHCVNGEICLQNNGYCANGCSNHFLYPLCQGNTFFFNILLQKAYCETMNEYTIIIYLHFPISNTTCFSNLPVSVFSLLQAFSCIFATIIPDSFISISNFLNHFTMV